MMSYLPSTPFWFVFSVHVGEEDGPRLGYDCGCVAWEGGPPGLGGGACVFARG